MIARGRALDALFNVVEASNDQINAGSRECQDKSTVDLVSGRHDIERLSQRDDHKHCLTRVLRPDTMPAPQRGHVDLPGYSETLISRKMAPGLLRRLI